MQDIVFWSWWILAGILLVGELLTTTTYLLWIAIAAGITGLVKWLWPGFNSEGQLVLFAVLSVLVVFLFRRYQRNKRIPGEPETMLNNRAEQMIGRLATLETPIVNGSGHVKFGDTTWLVSADTDFPPGSRIKVIGVDGTVLKVSIA